MSCHSLGCQSSQLLKWRVSILCFDARRTPCPIANEQRDELHEHKLFESVADVLFFFCRFNWMWGVKFCELLRYWWWAAVVTWEVLHTFALSPSLILDFRSPRHRKTRRLLKLCKKCCPRDGAFDISNWDIFNDSIKLRVAMQSVCHRASQINLGEEEHKNSCSSRRSTRKHWFYSHPWPNRLLSVPTMNIYILFILHIRRFSLLSYSSNLNSCGARVVTTFIPQTVFEAGLKLLILCGASLSRGFCSHSSRIERPCAFNDSNVMRWRSHAIERRGNTRKGFPFSVRALQSFWATQ